jgi:hypothetical protein
VLAIVPDGFSVPWRLGFTIVGVVVALGLSGAWVDVAVGLLLALVVVAAVHVGHHDEQPDHTPATALVSLPRSHLFLAGEQLATKQQATLIAMTEALRAHTRGATLRGHEYAVTVMDLCQRRSVLVAVDRDPKDAQLDALVDDLATSRIVYLMPARDAPEPTTITTTTTSSTTTTMPATTTPAPAPISVAGPTGPRPALLSTGPTKAPLPATCPHGKERPAPRSPSRQRSSRARTG